MQVGVFNGKNALSSQTELRKKVRCRNVVRAKPIMIVMEDRNEVPVKG